MPQVICPKCNCSHWYDNNAGMTIKLKCKTCQELMDIKYESAHKLPEAIVICPKCSERSMFAYIHSTHHAYRGSNSIKQKMIHHSTPSKMAGSIFCKKCGKDLSREIQKIKDNPYEAYEDDF